MEPSGWFTCISGLNEIISGQIEQNRVGRQQAVSRGSTHAVPSLRLFHNARDGVKKAAPWRYGF